MIWIDGTLLSPGKPGKGELSMSGMRVFRPERSKLAALYHLGEGPGIMQSDHILYLGAASGSTVSFIADYAWIVFAVEFAPIPLNDLLNLSKLRENIIPIAADARYPERYAPLVGKVDILYQDIAQRDQAEICERNLFMLKSGGTVVLMLKVLSISVSKDPELICALACNQLNEAGVTDLKVTWLDKYHRGHAAVTGKKI